MNPGHILLPAFWVLLYILTGIAEEGLCQSHDPKAPLPPDFDPFFDHQSRPLVRLRAWHPRGDFRYETAANSSFDLALRNVSYGTKTLRRQNRSTQRCRFNDTALGNSPRIKTPKKLFPFMLSFSRARVLPVYELISSFCAGPSDLRRHC